MKTQYKLDILIRTEEMPKELLDKLDEMQRFRSDVEWGYSREPWVFEQMGVQPELPYPVAQYKKKGEQDKYRAFGMDGLCSLINDIKEKKIEDLLGW